MGNDDDRGVEKSSALVPAGTDARDGARPTVDLDRRRQLMRIAGLGLGLVAISSGNLAHGLLVIRPQDPTTPVKRTCTSDTTASASTSGTQSMPPTDSITSTAPSSCSGSGSYTEDVQGTTLSTMTATINWSGPPSQVITVTQSVTYSAEPHFTVTITTSCSGGTMTVSSSGSGSTTMSVSATTSESATYTVDCPGTSLIPPAGECQQLPRRLIEAMELDHVDQPRSVLLSALRAGRRACVVSGL